MFTVDKKFPDFSLPAYFPEKVEDGRLSLTDFAGRWLVLFWYPADFTFVCPTELIDMQKRLDEYRALGAEIVGASTDTIFTHKGWIDREELLRGLRYPLIADHNGAFSRELGIYDEISGMAQRAAFIVDPEGMLRAVDIVADAIGRSSAELLRKLKALKFVHDNPGKVCPASWDDGAQTLTPSIKIAGSVGGELKQ